MPERRRYHTFEITDRLTGRRTLLPVIAPTIWEAEWTLRHVNFSKMSRDRFLLRPVKTDGRSPMPPKEAA